eukprot:NODE_267_length_11298_cov_1.167872.p11 type:complete len:103 gc:universal NODE_267_length_11298_cov_1.167872:8964-9272(+)
MTFFHIASNFRISIVRHLWSAVKMLVYSMTAIRSDYGTIIFIGYVVNDFPNFFVWHSRFANFYSLLQRLSGGIHEPKIITIFVEITNKIGVIAITVITIFVN